MTTFGTINEKGEVTENFKCDLNSLPSSDPLAFAYGISKGQYYLALEQKRKSKPRIEHGMPHKELAPEYLRGFLFGYRTILVPEGTKIREGYEQTYILLNLNTFKK